MQNRKNKNFTVVFEDTIEQIPGTVFFAFLVIVIEREGIGNMFLQPLFVDFARDCFQED